MAEPNILSIVKETRALLTDPKSWTQNVMARDSKGASCSPKAKDACQWCVMGAVRKVVPQEGPECVEDVLKTINAISSVINYHVPNWNDMSGRTHEDILSGLDRTIQELEK